MTDAETLIEFFRDRQDWLQVQVVPVPSGGWTVDLMLDGYYANQDMAEEVGEYLRERLRRALSSESIRLDNWNDYERQQWYLSLAETK